MSAPFKPASPGEILRARARAIAAAPAPAGAGGPALEVIEFGLGAERYAIEIAAVVEILPLEHLTPVPCTPRFIRGVINVRGRLVTVVDLRSFFELPDQGITDLHRAIILQRGDVEFGLLADYLVGTREVPVAALQGSLATLTGIRAEYLRGATAERLVVLDCTRLLTDARLVVDDAPAE